MIPKITNGEYEPTDSGVAEVDYIDEVLQNAALAITAKRGRFYPNKDFGSQIYKIDCRPFEEYALCYARQAVDGINGVYIKSVKLQKNTLIFSVTINDIEKEVKIYVNNRL